MRSTETKPEPCFTERTGLEMAHPYSLLSLSRNESSLSIAALSPGLGLYNNSIGVLNILPMPVLNLQRECTP